MECLPKSSISPIPYCDEVQILKMWLPRFIERHPHLYRRKQTPLAVARKNAHSIESIRAFYQRFRSQCMERGVQEQDIWNFDETGFRIGYGSKHIVILLYKRQELRIPDSENRDHITSVKCINSGGRSIPSFLILKGINILDKWSLKNQIRNGVILSTSPTGYTNNELSLAWIKLSCSLLIGLHRISGDPPALRRCPLNFSAFRAEIKPYTDMRTTPMSIAVTRLSANGPCL